VGGKRRAYIIAVEVLFGKRVLMGLGRKWKGTLK
jgi:hypothetical protein